MSNTVSQKEREFVDCRAGQLHTTIHQFKLKIINCEVKIEYLQIVKRLLIHFPPKNVSVRISACNALHGQHLLL